MTGSSNKTIAKNTIMLYLRMMVNMAISVEKTFGLKLTSKEILSWEDVGEMADAIYAKLA